VQLPAKKEPRFEGLQRFFRNVAAELKKVNWPSRKELVTYTIVVIATVVIMSVLIFGWDLILTEIFKVMGLYRTA
jgi:preprotein translocase subunit SecE